VILPAFFPVLYLLLRAVFTITEVISAVTNDSDRLSRLCTNVQMYRVLYYLLYEVKEATNRELGIG
jgi:hypothetical protein